jgi:hypothetical protein
VCLRRITIKTDSNLHRSDSLGMFSEHVLEHPFGVVCESSVRAERKRFLNGCTAFSQFFFLFLQRQGGTEGNPLPKHGSS